MYVTGGSSNFLLDFKMISTFAGAHLTAHSYVVTTLLKQLSCSECVGSQDEEYLKTMTLPVINQLQLGNISNNYWLKC